jgi:hypothetical protein
MDIGLFILRLLHIFGAIFWVGFGSFIFITPFISTDKAEAGRTLGKLFMSSKLSIVFPIAALSTVISGILLYLRNWSGVQNGASMTFGIGGAAGILAFIIGAMTGPMQARMGRLQREIAGGTPTAEQATQLTALESRLNIVGWAGFILMMIALFTMAIARYIPS